MLGVGPTFGDPKGLGRCPTHTLLTLMKSCTGEMMNIKGMDDLGPWAHQAFRPKGLTRCPAHTLLTLMKSRAGKMMNVKGMDNLVPSMHQAF